MSRKRFWLIDEQWRRIEPHFPTDIRMRPEMTAQLAAYLIVTTKPVLEWPLILEWPQTRVPAFATADPIVLGFTDGWFGGGLLSRHRCSCSRNSVFVHQ